MGSFCPGQELTQAGLSLMWVRWEKTLMTKTGDVEVQMFFLTLTLSFKKTL